MKYLPHARPLKGSADIYIYIEREREIRTRRLQCRDDTNVINAINLFKIGAVAQVW